MTERKIDCHQLLHLYRMDGDHKERRQIATSIFQFQEAFNVITRYELPVSPSDLEQVDSLRYTWQQLQATALGAHVQLLKMQPQFEDDLKNNLDRFREDNGEYVHEYRHAGPMQSGLTPREASDRLILFQVGYDLLVFVRAKIYIYRQRTQNII